MTEAEWLACDDPKNMLEYVRGKISDRKLRLFAVACCRRIWPLFTDDRSRAAVEVAERWADGNATEEERAEAQVAARAVWDNESDAGLEDRAAWAADILVRGEFVGDAWVIWGDRWASLIASETLEAAGEHEQHAQVGLVACIVGPFPFFSIKLVPRWSPINVVQLAHAIYEKPAFDLLPILADALEEAGCDNAEILNHCRNGREHVRGCWVVDLLLERV